MSCEYVLDDGAYVLGALAPAERAAFERHLSGCIGCREAVAALAVLPGLLGRLDDATAAALGGEPATPAPATLLPRVLAAAGTERRRQRRVRRWRIAVATAAAVAVSAIVGISVHIADQTPQPQLATMQPVEDLNVPITAEIGLTPVEGGTRVDMKCFYQEGTAGTWTFRLYIFARGVAEPQQVAAWMASAGQDLKFSSMTDVPTSDITRIEVRKANGDPVLAWVPV